MIPGVQNTRAGARVRSLLAAALAVAAGLSSACDSDSRRLPTEASPASAATAASDPAVERMPIIRIPRRRTGGPTPTPTLPGPRPTATPAPTSTLGPTATPGPTSPPPPTPTPTVPAPTPTRTAPAPTATPTVSATIAIRLRGINWQWDFFGPGKSGGPNITLKRGQPYRIEFFNDGPEDSSFHTFSGIAALALSAVSVAPGESVMMSFTPAQTGTFPYACTNSSCGVGHDNMEGTVTVVP